MRGIYDGLTVVAQFYSPWHHHCAKKSSAMKINKHSEESALAVNAVEWEHKKEGGLVANEIKFNKLCHESSCSGGLKFIHSFCEAKIYRSNV